MVRRNDRLQIEGAMYKVKTVDGSVVTLDKPLKMDYPNDVLPPALAEGKAGDVWVMVQNTSVNINLSMQMLLKSMNAHLPALQLLRLAFDAKKIKAEDLQVRAVLRAAYRLLKAMAFKFSLMQKELVAHVPLFLSHTEAQLVSHDISPTGCITTVFADNRTVCAQVRVETVRQFVRLAALNHSPRFLRFLSQLMVPNSIPNKRNQGLVIQSLVDREECLTLYNDEDEMAERDRLGITEDHVHNPRGLLVYHMELVSLLARAVVGQNPPVAVQLRTLLPLPTLSMHLLKKGLPLSLRAGFLSILDDTYLHSEKAWPPEWLEDLMQIMHMLRASIDRFLEEVLPASSFEDAEDVAEVDFIFTSVLSSIRLFYEHVYSAAIFGDEMVVYYKELIHVLILLGQATDERPHLMPPASVVHVLDAMDKHVNSLERVAVEEEALDVSSSDASSNRNRRSVSVRAKANRTDTSHPQEYMDDFMDDWATQINHEAGFKDLVAVFAKDLGHDKLLAKPTTTASQGAMQHQQLGHSFSGRRGSTVVKMLQDNTGAEYTRNLVSQLRAGRSADEGNMTGTGEIQQEEVTQTLTSLNVLIEMVNTAEGPEDKWHRQLALNLMGASAVAVIMASCERDELAQTGIKLAIALLDGGNSEVQNSFFRVLTDPHEDLTAFDGSPMTFVGSMRQRLRLAAREIGERKVYCQMQDERREAFEEEAEGLSAATVVAMRADLEAPFPARSHVLEVLELLQLLCEGHNNDMQDFMRVQPNSMNSVDLVAEVYDLLTRLEDELDDTNVDQAKMTLSALVEFVQGNTSKGATEYLLETKLLETLDNLLVTPSGTDDMLVELDDLFELQHLVLLLLLALVEGTERQAEERMLAVLEMKRVATLANYCYTEAMDPVAEEKTASLLLDVGFSLFMVLRHLGDYLEEKHGHSKKTVEVLGDVDEEAREYFGTHVARIEIVNAFGELESVHFRFPRFCLYLTAETKEEFLWQVDRETPGKNIQQFFLEVPSLHAEMSHQMELRKRRTWRFLLKIKPLAVNSMLVLAILQNIVLMFRYSYGNTPPVYADLEATANFLMGVSQLFSCVTVFMLYLQQSGTFRQHRCWKLATGLDYEEVLELVDNSIVWRLRWYVMTPYYLLTDRKLFFLGAAFLAAMLGLLVSPLFFSFQLLDMVNKSKDLQQVFRAVTLNGRSILVTALFGAVIIWIYAIVGYAFAQDLFLADDYPNDDIDMCTTLFNCWISALSNGLREGDIGHIMEPRPADDSRHWFLVVYQFSYYLIVITVLLNVIFGIIIDTFGELRTRQAAKRRHMESVCFICGVDRFTFDTQGAGFERHIKSDHNMWAYLYMLVHVREKDRTEYNGWEQYVADKMENLDTSFFPRNNAVVLREHRQREQAESLQLKQDVADVKLTVASLVRNMEKTEKHLMDKLENLSEAQQSLTNSFEANIARQARTAT